ncbi:MAG TPA: YdeI/OmpD-associated family protein [Candidatus Eisenbacteria bacterium]|nr:YdeI/OmpD-associated family protein [Candidatus Eisenbacteria bacterium]
MGTRDRRIDSYIAKSAPFARPILEHLREVVHEACPDVEETIKWRSPTFTYHGLLAGMAAFKEHAIFGFWKGSLIVDDKTPKGRSAMGQFGRITKVSELPSKQALKSLVQKAMVLNETAVKVKREPKHDKKPVTMPKELSGALARNKKAKLAFDAMSPSHRKEYMEWIGEAKRDETRVTRLQKTLAQLTEGKSLNWKYAKC